MYTSKWKTGNSYSKSPKLHTSKNVAPVPGQLHLQEQLVTQLSIGIFQAISVLNLVFDGLNVKEAILRITVRSFLKRANLIN